MTDQGLLLLIRFTAKKNLSVQELKQLGEWMAAPGNREVIHEWMQEEWNAAPDVESAVTYDQLIGEINKQYRLKRSTGFWDSKAVRLFQRAAAILIFPIALAFLYNILSQKPDTPVYSEVIVPKGQKSEIILPDSTHIWLNSDSRLRYPVRFSDTQREVFLKGEAYFEVEKDRHKPFIVHASAIAVKVLGTKFNVKAYPDDPEIETALLEGKVSLSVMAKPGKTEQVELNPGELVNYSGSGKSLVKTGFKTDEVVGWKSNRLIFRDDTFDKLVKKIERWYNVDINYDKSLFNDKRLTVELLEGESLERLFQVIGKAIDVNYKIDKQNITISPKMRN